MPTLTEISPSSPPSGLAYSCIGAFIAILSSFLLLAKEKACINEVVLATVFGILMGPLCLGIFDPRSWSHEITQITLEVTRFVLAFGLFAIGADLPKRYLHQHVKGLLVMVVPTMTIGWFIVAGLLKALFNRFDFITCLVLAACLTPTDPIISASVVGGDFAKEHVPFDIRKILLAESAANDGLAYPFLSISLYLALESDLRTAFKNWLFVGCFYEVLLGTFIGAVIGHLFSRVMRFSRKRGFVNQESLMAQCFALAIFTMGVVNTIASDDLLAAFAAGYTFSLDGGFDDQVEDGSIRNSELIPKFTSVLDYILNCGCFFYIGAWLPWEDFTSSSLGISPWRLVVLCIGILLLRRFPAILVLYKWVPEIKDRKQALLCGHFGPMGVSAIFISTLAKYRLPEPTNPPESPLDVLATALHPIVGFVVLVSIIVHGLSIAVFTAGKNVHSRTRKSGETLAILTTNEDTTIPEAQSQLSGTERQSTGSTEIPFTGPHSLQQESLIDSTSTEYRASTSPLVDV